ncbi:MAG TPA: hydantoinase B/oxoprolinase family protein [Solirubrobacterales bacterium]|jgi:N-methylhydantoinase B
MTTNSNTYTLDPVTFEVLKNSFTTIVDQMSEQVIRSCHSFVIWSRDFSCALCDAEGNTIMQGSGDCAAHVGTLHFTAKAVLDYFGEDIHEGDVFVVNDPYLGGTHFNDTRVVRPIFQDGEMIALAQANGHWADVGGALPGSFNIEAHDHMAEGLRIPPVRVWSEGDFQRDVAELIAHNTRTPGDVIGDMLAQAEATRVAEREIGRLTVKYGRETVVTAFAEVQDYVERLARARLAALPDGTWETVDYLDVDPVLGEGLIPIEVKMTIAGDTLHYDLSGSHPQAVHTFHNATFGGTFSGVVVGTKFQMPELPLNSGFYRPITVDYGREGSVVNATWPTPVAGFCVGPFDKLLNAIGELWAQIVPERAMACCFALEYLLVGGRDGRREGSPYFMWYDWMMGGWGARNGHDGHNGSAPPFGVQLGTQPLEGQERLAPVLTTGHELITDSGGPGTSRGGLGCIKGAKIGAAERAVMSYCCDRERSITWGLWGGLPSAPIGVRLRRAGGDQEEFLGALFSNVALEPGDVLERPSNGGGGLGDPLDRDPEQVLEDVVDEYVSVERARRDYGVVVIEIDRDLCACEIDVEATERERRRIRAERAGWLDTDPEAVAARYRAGELDEMDLVRQYGVILDWGSGEVLAKSTGQFREMLRRRALAYWADAGT